MSRILDRLTADRIFEWAIGNRLFELGDLNPTTRAVSWFGYGSLLALLGSMLGLQVMGIGLPTTDSTVVVQVVIIACLGFVAAWALIMTGVLYARRAVAVLFLIVFGIQTIVLGARIVYVSFGLIVLATCIQVLFRVQPRLRDWNRTPLVSLAM